MTYLLLALAALVYLWPAEKHPPTATETSSTTYQAALSSLTAVRARLIQTQSFSDSCREAFRTLAMAVVEGSDL